jgi:hypothetical protein
VTTGANIRTVNDPDTDTGATADAYLDTDADPADIAETETDTNTKANVSENVDNALTVPETTSELQISFPV